MEKGLSELLVATLGILLSLLAFVILVSLGILFVVQVWHVIGRVG